MERQDGRGVSISEVKLLEHGDGRVEGEGRKCVRMTQ